MGEPLTPELRAALARLVVEGRGVRGAARGLGMSWATVGRAHRGEAVSHGVAEALRVALETANGDVAARGRRARWTGAEVAGPVVEPVEHGPGRREGILSVSARYSVEIMTPGFGSRHLDRVWDVWEAAEAGGGVRAVVAAPPRGGKSLRLPSPHRSVQSLP